MVRHTRTFEAEAGLRVQCQCLHPPPLLSIIYVYVCLCMYVWVSWRPKEDNRSPGVRQALTSCPSSVLGTKLESLEEQQAVLPD